jgi:transcriptional regulator GlxA family with amidase domain
LFITLLGTTPGQYVEQIRIEAARQLLEAGDDPMETVARRCGSAAPRRCAEDSTEYSGYRRRTIGNDSRPASTYCTGGT